MSTELQIGLSSLIRWSVLFALFILFFFTFTKKGHRWMQVINVDKFAKIVGWILLSVSFIFIVMFMAIYRAWYYLPQTNLCTMTYWTLAIALISKKDKWINPLLQPAFIGGMIYFLGGSQNMFESWLTAIVGAAVIVRHSLLVLAGIMWVRISPTYTELDFKKSTYYMLILLAYIFVVTTTLRFATGDDKWGVYSMGMWPESYYAVNVSIGSGPQHIETAFTALGAMGLPYPVPTIIMYVSAYSMMWGMAKLYIFLVEKHDAHIRLKWHLYHSKEKTLEVKGLLKEMDHIPLKQPRTLNKYYDENGNEIVKEKKKSITQKINEWKNKRSNKSNTANE